MTQGLAGLTSMPLLSVVTPTLNQAAFLEETLDSVAQQDYPRIEHIVVDGGSTDGTVEILRTWEQAHGLIWLSEPDNGMYDAVNKGLRMASGDLLTYLNSDDTWFPWTVRTAVTALTAAPSAAFVFGDVLNFDDVAGTGAIGFYPATPPGAFRRTGRLGQPGVVWRRSAQDVIGLFDDSLRYAGDTDFFVRLASRFGGARVDEVLAREREYPARASQAMAREVAAEIAVIRHRQGTPVSPRRAAAHRLQDRLGNAVRHRVAVARYLASARPADSGRAGGWQHFRACGAFRVERAAMAASIIPAVGRPYERYVHRAVAP